MSKIFKTIFLLIIEKNYRLAIIDWLFEIFLKLYLYIILIANTGHFWQDFLKLSIHNIKTISFQWQLLTPPLMLGVKWQKEEAGWCDTWEHQEV